MATKFKPTTASRINESTDFSVKEIVRSKIIKYAQDRLNKSGAVLLAPVYDMINFNDPLDGMISFDYLNTIAENEELSEDESGYDYIEQAVTDIANFIQNQGFIMDEDSDDPLVFIDENYDEEDDEELDDMNESVKWTETDEPNQWVNKLTKNKEAIDPITLECKDLGVAVFASKLSEDADNNFYKVMIVNSNTGKSMTKSLPFDGIDLESAISKLKKCDNKDDLYDTISKYLFLRKSDVFKLFGISMNESASITKTDNYDEFNLLPPGNKFMDPIKLENKELGIWATAGVMFDEDDPDNEDDYSAVVLVSPLDPKYENYVVAGDFSDNYSAAKNIMKKLAQIKTPDELAKIIKDKKFSDYYGIKSNTDFLVDVVRKLYSKMNESTVMNEAVQVTKPKPNEAKSHYISKEGSTMIQNKQLGFYAIVGDYYDEDEPEFEGDISAYISTLGTSTVSIDDKKINEVLESTFDNRNKANTMMKELSDVDNLTDLAKILRKYEFYNSDMDTTKGQREFISILESKISNINESTMMINESAKIKPCNPELEGFDLLGSNNPFDFEPVDLENEELGFYAIAGVATGADVGADWIEDDCSIEICVTALDPDYTDEVLVAEYYDVDYKAMNVMQELASATSYNKLTSILVKEGFQGMNSGPFDFVDDLEAINSMNEATEVPDGRMTVELDDTDVVEGDTLLLAELTDDVFNAVNTVLDELDPDADVEITIDNEDLLQLAVVSDEDLDDDAFDQVLSELLEDMDLEDIVADMTDSEPIEDPDDEDFGRVIQYINFYPATGATVVPDNSVMEDNIDVIEDEDVINESTAPDYSSLANKVKDCIATYYSEGVVQRASVEVNKNKDSVVCVDLKFPNRDGIDAKEAKAVSKLVLSKFDNLRTLSNKKEAVPQFNTRIDIKGDCLVYYVMPYNNARPGEAILARYNFVVTNSSMNESFKLNTDLTKFVDKLADSFFGSIKDANFLNLEDEDGNLYFQVSTGDKSYSRKLLTNFLAFLAKKNVDFDLVNKVNVTGNSTFWNATVIVKINNKQGSQVQYRNELNESTEYNRISHYVDDLNFKSGVKFLEGDDKIEKVLKAINPKADIRFYGLDKLPWTTYKIDGRDYVAVFGISGRLFTPMAISITDGKNISDFINNSKSILTFTNKKLQDWNNVVIPVRIMNNLAKVTDRASEYKAIKSLLDKYEKQVYNYEQFDESVDPIYESYYKDTDEDLSIDQAKITKALKAISRILTKEGYPLDNLDKVYRFNYPRPGLVEINLINTLKSTYGRISDKAYDIDSKIEKKLESLNLTYASKDKYGKEIYTDDDKLVHYDGKDISKYIQTGKVPDREFRNNRVDAVNPKKPASALKSKLEEMASGIEKYVKSHPDYKKFNLSKDVVHVGEDYIQITVDTPDVEVGKSILIDTDKFISKNYKDLETHSKSKDGSKPVWSVYVMKSSAAKDLMNESTNYKKFANKLETFINDEIDTIYDEMVVSVDETGYGYNINVTFDNRLLGSNPSKIISKIINFIVERNGEYSDLVHYNNKVTGDYKLVFSYKGKLNECAIIGPDETDIDSLRANELSRALSSEQPLVDPYDIRCTIRPVFVRKDQFLFDGSTVYKATANASTDKDSGTTEIKVDVLLSTDPDISDASMTLTLPTEFDGLKLLRGNPTKVYNESADVKADTVTLSFANEDEANEFIKDNGVKPEKSFEGKFGWTVILKKSDLKKIK